MTMPPPAHPDPERLAALAGDDADARADRALVEHVASCPACGPQVREMASLRAALAQLPDVAPSRPLQLVPPVPEPTASGWRVGLRRALAPVAAAGVVLVLIGGVGATGALGPAEAPRLSMLPLQQAASAPDPAQPEIDQDGEGLTDNGGQTDGGVPTDAAGRPATASAPPPIVNGGAGLFGSPTPSNAMGGQGAGEEPASRGEDLDPAPTPTSGWVFMLAIGLALLAVALILRTLAPRRSPAAR